MLARYYDTGTHDPSAAVEQHEQFRMRIDYLFVQGNCRDFGYTRHALIVLQSVYTIPLAKGTKTIGGGVSDHDFNACLQRLRAWVYMATVTIQSEFPRWDVTHCCSIFRLDDSRERQAVDGRGRQLCILRISQVLGLDATRLQAQLDMVYPFAAALKSHSKGMSTMDAWRQAVMRLSSLKSQRFHGKVNTLRKALLRACAWQGSTTSGVEQFFSRVDLGAFKRSLPHPFLVSHPLLSLFVLGNPLCPLCLWFDLGVLRMTRWGNLEALGASVEKYCSARSGLLTRGGVGCQSMQSWSTFS